MAQRLLVGTRKGAWIYTANDDRSEWTLSQPFMPGWTISHMAADTRRAAPRIFAGGNHWAWGPTVAKSDDLGETWDQRSPGLAFEPDFGETVSTVWNVTPGREGEDGVVWAGTQPAGLFKSEDWGETWTAVNELNKHPHRGALWTGTGGGDSALHSVLLHPTNPNKMYASIAAGGTYVTDDGGKTWNNCSHYAVATTPEAVKFMEEIAAMFPEEAPSEAIPENVDPAAVNEMHKVRLDPTNPSSLWAQTHIGVFRSDDSAESWVDVTAGLPSFHGFPIGVSKNGDGRAWVVPLEFGDHNFRVCPGQFAVYRTSDEGASWERLTEGLPGPDDYQSVYREGIDTDGEAQEGVYVGTTNGEVYASADGGDHWQRLPGTLPPILSVTCAEF